MKYDVRWVCCPVCDEYTTLVVKGQPEYPECGYERVARCSRCCARLRYSLRIAVDVQAAEE